MFLRLNLFQWTEKIVLKNGWTIEGLNYLVIKYFKTLKNILTENKAIENISTIFGESKILNA